jgi:hypothetical protein
MKKCYCDVCNKEIVMPKEIQFKVHIKDMYEGNMFGYEDNEGARVSGRILKYELCQSCYNKIMLKAYEEMMNIKGTRIDE